MNCKKIILTMMLALATAFSFPSLSSAGFGWQYCSVNACTQLQYESSSWTNGEGQTGYNGSCVSRDNGGIGPREAGWNTGVYPGSNLISGSITVDQGSGSRPLNIAPGYTFNESWCRSEASTVRLNYTNISGGCIRISGGSTTDVYIGGSGSVAVTTSSDITFSVSSISCGTWTPSYGACGSGTWSAYTWSGCNATACAAGTENGVRTCNTASTRTVTYSCVGGPCSGSAPANTTEACTGACVGGTTDTRACNATGGTGTWTLGSYSGCTATACSAGTETATYTCTGGNGQCCTAQPANLTRSCAATNTGTWTAAASWSGCTATACSAGTERKAYTCQGGNGLCCGSQPADLTQACAATGATGTWTPSSWGSCSATPTWVAGTFSGCTATACSAGTESRTNTCTGTAGTQTRTYTCTGGTCCTSNPYPSGESQACSGTCNPATQPTTSQSCPQTNTGTWTAAASWSGCTATACSAGTERKAYTCQGGNGLCCGSAPADLTQTCAATGGTGTWTPSAYGSCTGQSQCTGGTKARTYSCTGGNGVCCTANPYPSGETTTVGCEATGGGTWTPAASWSGCNATSCSAGTERKAYTCVGGGGVCCTAQPADLTQSCAATNTGTWTAAASWSGCTATACSAGTERKAYTCQGGNGLCCGSAPADLTQTCAATGGTGTWTAGSCSATPTWVAGTFSGCTATACSAGTETRTNTCTGTSGTQSYTCQGGNGQCCTAQPSPIACTASCNAGTQPSTSQACSATGGTGTWTAAASWSACSASCGPGTQTKAYSCTGGNGVCCSAQPAALSQSCNNGSCVTPTWITGSWGGCTAPARTWTSGAWGACSNSCGAGTQTRTNTCDAITTGTETRTVTCSTGVDADCIAAQGAKPATSQACTNSTCATQPATSQACTGTGTGTWTVGAYSGCTATACTAGTETATYTCTGGNGVCCTAQPANATRSCSATGGTGTWTLAASWSSCSASPTWVGGSWGTCSNSCGAGTQTRTNTCTGTIGTQTKAYTCQGGNGQCCLAQPAAQTQACSSSCNPATEPTTSQSCTGTGGTGVWTASSWSACSATPTWSSGAWGSCSASCGAGTQTRTNSCTGTAGTQSRTYTCTGGTCCTANPFPLGESQSCAGTCNPATEPTSAQSCNNGSCATPTWVVGSWSACSATSPTWSSGSWGACSAAPCAAGIQTRVNTCTPTTGTQTRTVTCSTGTDADCITAQGAKPATSQSCSNSDCGAEPINSQNCTGSPTGTWSAGGWGACVSGSKTRTYTCTGGTCCDSNPYPSGESTSCASGSGGGTGTTCTDASCACEL
jgi:hypothetical protein